jgi:hypothetical protein
MLKQHTHNESMWKNSKRRHRKSRITKLVEGSRSPPVHQRYITRLSNRVLIWNGSVWICHRKSSRYPFAHQYSDANANIVRLQVRTA